MTQMLQERLYIAPNGLRHAIGPDDPAVRAYHEALIAEDYASCHPGDSLDGLKRRARFTKEDKGLLVEWMARGAAKAAEPSRGKR